MKNFPYETGLVKLTGALLLMAALHASAQMIPADRRIDWGNTAGVPGGIPERTTIHATLNPGATAAQINSAIASCPSNRVVFLNAGTYNVGAINFGTRHGVTLRGAGPGRTILNSTASSACVSADQYGFAGAQNIVSGYAKGSSNIVIASAAGYQPGNLIRLSEGDDSSFVFTTRGLGRHIQFMARITAVNGNALTFWPPLPYGFRADLSPQVQYLNGGPGLSMAGIEDMTIVNGGGASDIIQFIGTFACWVKNVELTRGHNSFIFFVSCLQNEVRHCYIHDANNFPQNTDGFGVYVYENSTSCRIEDNIFRRLGVGILQTATSGNAFLFNYIREVTFNGWPYQTGGMNAGHGAHPMFCLWEGNVSEQWQHDGYHGSASHQVLFRNWLHGVSELGATGNRKMISAERGSHFYTVVGNVLGDASWTNAAGFGYQMTGSPGYTEAAVMYRLGYPNVANNSLNAAVAWPTYTGGYPDARVASTMLRHGNYDWFNRRIVWDSSISDQRIPDSLAYASKPAYFGNRPWPPFDPAASSAATRTNIPAGFRYVFGIDPPAGPVNRAPIVSVNATPTLGLPPLSVAFSSAGSSDPEGATLTYSWNFGDGTAASTVPNPTHIYQAAGSYFARLTVSDGTNSVTSSDINIRVGNQPPVVVASATPSSGAPPLTVTFSSSGSSDPEGAALTYNWNFGDGSSSTAANPSHTYQTNGVFTARLTVSDGTSSVFTNLQITVSSGLVAAYDFDAGQGTTVQDASGLGNHGAIQGAVWHSSGRFGGALSFNGGNAVVTVNSSPSLNLTSGMTLEAWVYPAAFNADYRSIISKPVDASFSTISYVLHGASRANNVPSTAVSSSTANLAGPQVLPLNTWSHLAATYNGSTLRLFVNGAQVASQSQTGLISSSSEALRIGLSWAGLIDEVRIYNRALTGTEIQQDMDRSVTGVTRPAPPQGFNFSNQ